MTTCTGQYLGTKRVSITHDDSGAVIQTSAPKDNAGDGAQFSPTDLVGTALGSCMITVMAIVAERKGIAFNSASFTVEKEMQTSPRRIGRLGLAISLPASLLADERKILEAAAVTCPVHQSLHPDIDCDLSFEYK